MKLMLSPVLVLAALAGCAWSPDRPGAAVMNELAPTGKLRFGVVAAPEGSPFFMVKDADGRARGVTVDLANELARQLGTPLELVVAPNSGILTDALASGTLDASFLPVDEERRKRLDVGPVYFVAESTYLVRPGSDIRNLADVDRPDVRVIGIANTTTIRSAARTLKNTKVAPANSVDEAFDLLSSGKADAFALSRDSLAQLALRLPGSRVLDGAFQQVSVAIVVPKNRPNALAYATAFLESAKASGLVRRAFDKAGFNSLAVAPASQR